MSARRHPAPHAAPPPAPAGEDAGFTPSLLPQNPDDFLHAMLGEAARFLDSHPEFKSPRAIVDLWNLFRNRSRTFELDDFGYDEVASRPWTELFDFLYSVWWRVTLSGVDNIPMTGRALIVANHSGVLPWDGAMVKRVFF